MLEGIEDDAGFVSSAIITHDAGDGKVKIIVVSDCIRKKRIATCCLWDEKEIGEAVEGCGSDTDMKLLPTDIPAIGLVVKVPAHAVGYPIETRQRLYG